MSASLLLCFEKRAFREEQRGQPLQTWDLGVRFSQALSVLSMHKHKLADHLMVGYFAVCRARLFDGDYLANQWLDGLLGDQLEDLSFIFRRCMHHAAA